MHPYGTTHTGQGNVSRRARRLARDYRPDLLRHAAARLWLVWRSSHLPPWTTARTARLAADCEAAALIAERQGVAR